MILKFCGIKNFLDIKKAILLKANLIGINFYKKSNRYIGNDFPNIISKIPSYIGLVGLFVNESFNEINKKKKYFDILQFHGNENFLFCESLNKKYIKTIRLNEKKNFNIFYSSNNFFSFLIDKKNFFFGGSGISYSSFKINKKIPIFISGGLYFNNLKVKKNIFSCINLDICSGLEYKEKKNYKKMKKI